MGIDGLTPADRFFGRADQVLSAVDGISRRRQGASAMTLTENAPLEEILGIRTGAPLEVLRLVIEDGRVVTEETLFESPGERIRDVRSGPDGCLYLLTDSSDGRIVRVSPD